jgi:hypothetical protein
LRMDGTDVHHGHCQKGGEGLAELKSLSHGPKLFAFSLASYVSFIRAIAIVSAWF